jgi:ketosteroid isomerase-like protein
MSQENVEAARRCIEAYRRGDYLIVAVRYRGRGRVSGVEVNDLLFEVHTLRDGRCTRKVEFPTRAEALEAVELSE